MFLNPPVSLNIHEGEDTEQVFLTITATDADEGSNGEVTYSLDGGQGNRKRASNLMGSD